MSNITNRLVLETIDHVSKLLDSELSKELLFHSTKHTIDVMNYSEIIAKYSGLNESDINMLKLSALFHDVGYIKMYKNHEAESVKMATDYLKSKNVDESIIEIITESILSTQIPQNPTSIIAEMVCDADLMHLTIANYFEQIELLRLEWNNLGIAKMDEKNFHLHSIDFFQSHNYYSKYGKEILEPKKQLTLQKIKNRILELD